MWQLEPDMLHNQWLCAQLEPGKVQTFPQKTCKCENSYCDSLLLIHLQKQTIKFFLNQLR